jgi:hypothetical protein
MRVLDCESIETTYNSLEGILGIQRDAIDVAFQDLDVERFYRDNPRYPEPPDDLVFSVVTNNAPSPPVFDKVCWFHLTRTAVTNTFEHGILSLGQQIDSIWNFLHTLLDDGFPREEWNDFRRHSGDSHSAYLYRMKVGNPLHWGPYAILVRDVAFKAKEVGNHDYLRAPEVVEDICMCFSEKYGFDLLDVFLKGTKPCIVKFVDNHPRSDCLLAALYYLYSAYHEQELSRYCNTCFDGEGVLIPKERILKIEFLDY